MKIKFSYLIITVLVFIFCVSAVTIYYVNQFERESQPVVRQIEISSSNRDSSVFIKLKSWGITGDHQIITISENSSDSFQLDRASDYFYEGLIPFFYKQKGDTLKVYVSKKSPVPEYFESNIVIEQFELNNAELMNLYDDKSIKKISN